MKAWLSRRSARQHALLAIAGGALTALALPPLHVLPALLLTLPCLLLQIGCCRSARQAAATGFWFGFGLNLVGLYWITDAILIEAAQFWWLVPVAVPALAVVLAAFIAVPCGVAWYASPGWRRVAALAGAWVLADLARQFVGTGFPWNPLGSVWAMPGHVGDVFLQPASVIGVHGLTLLTLLLAATPILGRGAMVAGLLVVGQWAAMGNARLAHALPSGPAVTLVLVQGNIPEGRKMNQAYAQDIFARYLTLTAQGLAQARATTPEGAVAVVWPESASPFLLEQDVAARADISAALGGAVLLAGSVRFDAAGRPRNSLLVLNSAAPPLAVYDKWHLVPFGEYQPSWLPLQILPGGGFASGPGPRTLAAPGLPPFGPLICYEAIFPAQVVDPAQRPDWLVNVTNDAWFGNSAGPRQHLAAARLRAVEEGLPLARAANTGISALFDAHGHEITRLGLDREGVLVAALPPPAPATFASRWGLLPAGLLSILCLAAGLVGRGVPGRLSQKR